MEVWFSDMEISIKKVGLDGTPSVLKRTSLKKKKFLTLNNLA
jgi:hypothetical protein